MLFKKKDDLEILKNDIEKNFWFVVCVYTLRHVLRSIFKFEVNF